ncbi:hypothetical protein GCM10009795_005340 [Nocardioides hankookensis]
MGVCEDWSVVLPQQFAGTPNLRVPLANKRDGTRSLLTTSNLRQADRADDTLRRNQVRRSDGLGTMRRRYTASHGIRKLRIRGLRFRQAIK